MPFRNQRAFDDPKSRMAATGADLRPANAITDSQGTVLFYAQTGGMLSPTRYEIPVGSRLYRFGSAAAGVGRVATGAWWIDQSAFEQLFRFAQTWDLSIGVAMRVLCLVPPEWSDATLLVRARTQAQLLAWRGLAAPVVTPAKGGGAPVRLPQPNDIAARRLHQLFIPGLADPGIGDAVVVEQSYPLDKAASLQGFLYV